jgi:hypothetical protein
MSRRAAPRSGSRLFDRSNHHLFQPLLYQVATAALSPADIAAPIRRVFRHQANVEVMLADATAVDAPGKRVVLSDGSVDYDVLILATGATHAYFGHDDWAEHAIGLKTLKDALRIRQRVVMAFEIAEREPDEAAGVDDVRDRWGRCYCPSFRNGRSEAPIADGRGSPGSSPRRRSEPRRSAPDRSIDLGGAAREPGAS